MNLQQGVIVDLKQEYDNIIDATFYASCDTFEVALLLREAGTKGKDRDVPLLEDASETVDQLFSIGYNMEVAYREMIHSLDFIVGTLSVGRVVGSLSYGFNGPVYP